MPQALKNRASKLPYISTTQLAVEGFDSPFAKHLNPDNRWVKWAHKIPWDALVGVYSKQMGNAQTGADGINPRVAIGAIIIKHICDLSDRETVQQIQENMYMQYFIGYSSFSDEAPFDASLFVEFRNRLGIDQVNMINEKILGLSKERGKPELTEKDQPPPPPGQQAESSSTAVVPTASAVLPAASVVSVVSDAPTCEEESKPEEEKKASAIPNKGKVIVDATACPQDIRYPTDLNLLNDAREKSEELIDILFNATPHHTEKPRT